MCVCTVHISLAGKINSSRKKGNEMKKKKQSEKNGLVDVTRSCLKRSIISSNRCWKSFPLLKLLPSRVPFAGNVFLLLLSIFARLTYAAASAHTSFAAFDSIFLRFICTAQLGFSAAHTERGEHELTYYSFHLTSHTLIRNGTEEKISKHKYYFPSLSRGHIDNDLRLARPPFDEWKLAKNAAGVFDNVFICFERWLQTVFRCRRRESGVCSNRSRGTHTHSARHIAQQQ